MDIRWKEYRAERYDQEGCPINVTVIEHPAHILGYVTEGREARAVIAHDGSIFTVGLDDLLYTPATEHN